MNIENLVFCTGSPKSGTTFLQMILNNHPEVSCPSEHQLDFFLINLPKLLETYNNILKIIDKRTANQGASTFINKDFEKIFEFIIKLAAYRGANGKKLNGMESMIMV